MRSRVHIPINALHAIGGRHERFARLPGLNHPSTATYILRVKSQDNRYSSCVQAPLDFIRFPAVDWDNVLSYGAILDSLRMDMLFRFDILERPDSIRSNPGNGTHLIRCMDARPWKVSGVEKKASPSRGHREGGAGICHGPCNSSGSQ